MRSEPSFTCEYCIYIEICIIKENALIVFLISIAGGVPRIHMDKLLICLDKMIIAYSTEKNKQTSSKIHPIWQELKILFSTE